MDIQEQDLVGPAEGLVGRRSTLKLSDNDRLLLANWAQSAEYSIFLRLAEALIEVAETTHFKSFRDRDKFVDTGLIAVAKRDFFEQLQKEVNTQYEEFAGELEFIKTEKQNIQASPEEQIQRSFQ
jgi:hypothetical protein